MLDQLMPVQQDVYYKPGNELVGHSGNDEIGTPDGLWNKINARYRLDYDAFASHDNALCDSYSTIGGTFEKSFDGYPPAMASAQSGLDFPWKGMRVFLNPPYSNPLMRQAIEKCIAERNNAEIIVGLFKCDTSTGNFKLLNEYADLTFLKRVKYKGMKQAATFASCIAVFRQDW